MRSAAVSRSETRPQHRTSSGSKDHHRRPDVLTSDSRVYPLFKMKHGTQKPAACRPCTPHSRGKRAAIPGCEDPRPSPRHTARHDKRMGATEHEKGDQDLNRVRTGGSWDRWGSGYLLRPLEGFSRPLDLTVWCGWRRTPGTGGLEGAADRTRSGLRRRRQSSGNDGIPAGASSRAHSGLADWRSGPGVRTPRDY